MTSTTIKLALTGFLVLATVMIIVFRRRDSTLSSPVLGALSGADIVLIGTLLVFSVLLTMLGLRHYDLTDYSVEWDFIWRMLRAQTWRSVFSADARIPFGYPLLLRLVTLLTGDAFTSGKIIAGLSSVAVLSITYLLARRLFEPLTALLCALALPFISLFAENTMMVETDMPALALVLLSVYLVPADLGRGSTRLVLAGALGGLSYLVRPSAIVLIPAIVAWIASQGDLDIGHRVRTSFAFVAAFLLVITPQLTANWAQKGFLFDDSQNAKDVWMDAYGNWDWALWPSIGEISMRDVILMDPVRFVTNWARNLLDTFRHSPIDWPLAWFTIPGFLALPFTRPKREVGLTYWFGGAYVALVSIAWSTVSAPRILLMIVPFATMVAVWLFLRLIPSELEVAHRKVPWQVPLFSLALLLMMWNGKPYIAFLQPGVERHHSFVKPEIQTPLGVRLETTAGLLGYGVDKRQLHPAETLHLTLYWRAEYVGSKNYSVFVHLVGPDGQIWAQADSWPCEGKHPTSVWLTTEFIEDLHEVVVPPDAPAGSYKVLIGMYLLDTGERLDVFDENGQPQGNAITLEPFEVVSP